MNELPKAKIGTTWAITCVYVCVYVCIYIYIINKAVLDYNTKYKMSMSY